MLSLAPVGESASVLSKDLLKALIFTLQTFSRYISYEAIYYTKMTKTKNTTFLYDYVLLTMTGLVFECFLQPWSMHI